MGVRTSRTFGVQGAGVLGVILPDEDHETQLWFLVGKCHMRGIGGGLWHAQHIAKLSATSCEAVIAGHINSTPNHVLAAPILATVFNQWSILGVGLEFRE